MARKQTGQSAARKTSSPELHEQALKKRYEFRHLLHDVLEQFCGERTLMAFKKLIPKITKYNRSGRAVRGFGSAVIQRRMGIALVEALERETLHKIGEIQGELAEWRKTQADVAQLKLMISDKTCAQMIFDGHKYPPEMAKRHGGMSTARVYSLLRKSR